MTDELVCLDETNHGEIEALLLGRRIVAAEMGNVSIPFPDTMPDWEKPWWANTSTAEGVLTLDDGTRIFARGHEGGCSCGAGDYPLARLASTDNVITSVRFEDRPADESADDGYGVSDRGWYRIFVVADSVEINVASFEGSDGNGYYGTGYELYVWRGEAIRG